MSILSIFLRPLSQRALKPKYAPLNTGSDCRVRLLYDSSEEHLGLETSLSDLLRSYREDGESIFVFESEGHEVFLIFTVCAHAETTQSVDAALRTCQTFIDDSRQGQVSVLYKTAKTDLDPRAEKTILAVIARYDVDLAKALGVPSARQQQIMQTIHVCKTTARRTARLGVDLGSMSGLSVFFFPTICIVVALLLVIVVIIASLKEPHHSQNIFRSWKAYDTRDSIGPEYQLSVYGPNATTWTSSDIYKNNDWALRLDDQALVPMHLFTPSEQRYQTWISEHYPSISALVKDQKHLNGTWLSSPAVDNVMVDELFHFSHCVLAVRRYIDARESGRHVCGRDIDKDHVRHCLDALDWWAFPDERRTNIENFERPFGWRTKVCFD